MNSGRKKDTLHSNEARTIVAVSMKNYLLGALQGFCNLAGCVLKLLPCDDASVFLQTVEKEEPLIVFINIVEAKKILLSPKWNKAQTFLQRKNVPICGIGDLSVNQNNFVHMSIFTRVFNEPINIDEVLGFVRTRLKSDIERRKEERRKGEDRRKQLGTNGKNYNPGVNKSSRKRDYITAAGVLSIDHGAMTVTVNDRLIEISPKEFQLIDLLLQNLGCVVNAEDIIKVIWSGDCRATKADVHQYIYILRHKLEENPHKPKLLVTVKGFGYKLCL